MRSTETGVVLAALVSLAVAAGSAPTTEPAKVEDFEVEGIGYTHCQCPAYGCPCRANAHPTHHSCEAADFAYIKRGHYGGVKLDGLKAAVVGDLLNVDSAKRYATVYFDEKTTPQQREAHLSMLKFMFGPTWPVQLGPPKVVPIEFTESPDRTVYTLKIPGILEEKAVLKRDQQGKPVNTVPAMDQWGNAIHYADSVVFKYSDRDAGKSWDLSGRQANVKYFHTTDEMYASKELLAQHGDQSGGWNAKQKEMIQKLGMKVE